MSNKRRTQTKDNKMIKIGKDLSKFLIYSCRPTSREELKEIIKERISSQGNKCDLNDIDTSLIKDMSYLFYESDFNGYISCWDVSNVDDMWGMFACSNFNGDISNWNVSKVIYMNEMFTESEFNQDISKWNVSNVKNMISMFRESKFNQDISNWNISEDCNISRMFYKCPIRKEFKPR